MFIRFQCTCGKTFKVTADYAGKRSKCPKCGTTMIIPPSSPPEPAPASTPPPAPKPATGLSLAADAPPPQPPPPANGGMELVEEHFGVGGKTDVEPVTPAPAPAPAPAPKPAGGSPPELQLVTESFGIGGKTDVEPAKAPAIEPVAATPAAAPAIGPGAPTIAPPAEGAAIAVGAAAEERRCGKCGMPVPVDAVICVECGAKLAGKDAPAPDAAPAAPPKKKGLAGAIQRLRRHKQFRVIVAAAAVVVLGLGTAAVLMVKKALTPPPPPPPAAVAPPTTLPAPKPEEKPKPPEPEVRWTGFADPAATARDRLARAGGLLVAHLKDKPAPAALADAGVPTADASAFTYVGPEIASEKRLRLLLNESGAGTVNAFFSDGAIWPLSADDLKAVKLTRQEGRWLTKADAALLTRMGPQARVTNLRPAPVRVAIDNAPPKTVAPGQTVLFPVPAGARRATLTLAGKTDSVACEFRPGVVFAITLPRNQDLPYIPVRLYRELLQSPKPRITGYTLDADGSAVKSMRSALETVFPGAKGRNAVTISFDAAVDGHTFDGRIERDAYILDELDGKPIQVNEINRMEQGLLRYRNGASVVYLRSKELGVVRTEELPNVEVAALALYPAVATTAGRRPGMPGLPPGPALPEMPSAMPPAMMPGPGGRALAPVAKLEFAAPAFRIGPDCQLLSAASKVSHEAATQLLLRLAQPTEKMDRRAMPYGAPEAPGLPPGGPLGPGRTGPGGREAPSMPADKALACVEIPPATLYATLAVYADPGAARFLATQYEKTAEQPGAGFGELLLALARCGGASMVSQIESAAAKAPLTAAIALTTIDHPAARNALAKVLAGWKETDMAQAAKVWPPVAGPACRAALVEVLAWARPDLLDSVPTLNALMAFEPGTLERVLVARVVPAPPPPATASASTTTLPGAAPREHEEPPPAPAVTASVASAKLGAPPSWLVLAHLRNRDAVEYFIKLLTQKDAAKKEQALVALAEVKDASLVAPVAATLLREKETPVRRAAVRLLVSFADADAAKALIQAMDKELLLTAVVDAVPAFVRNAGRDATAELLVKMVDTALKDTKAPDAKRGPGAPPPPPVERMPGMPGGAAVAADSLASPAQVVKALSQLGAQSDAAKAALDAALKHSEPAVRAAAWSGRTPDAAALAEAMKDASPVVKVAALELLKGAPAATAARLLEAAFKDPAPEVRLAALKLLPTLSGADAAASKLIAEALTNDDPLLVAAATEAAMKDPNPALGPALLAALSKQSTARVEEGAAGALAVLIEAVAARRVADGAMSIASLLANPSLDIKVVAVRALIALRDPKTSDALAATLNKNKEPEIVAAALPALGQSDDPTVIKAVLDFVQRDDLAEEARELVLSHLAARCAAPGPYANWLAKGGLKEGDFDVLLKLAAKPGADRKGFIQIGRRGLADSNTEVRHRAADLLGRFTDDAEVRRELLATLKADVSNVAGAVGIVLSQTTDVAGLAALGDMYNELAAAAGAGATSGGTGANTSGTTTGSTAAPAPARAPKYPGLAKVSAEENLLLRKAIVLGIAAVGLAPATAEEKKDLGEQPKDELAARTLRRIWGLDKSPEIVPAIIAAYEKMRSGLSIQFLSEYVMRPDPARPDALGAEAVAAIARLAPLDREDALKALREFVRGTVPAETSAVAADAVNDLESKPDA